jgi:hypothetical protein
MIFAWVVIDPFQKFFVGAKQPKRKKEQSWPGAGSEQTAPGIKRKGKLDLFLRGRFKMTETVPDRNLSQP